MQICISMIELVSHMDITKDNLENKKGHKSYVRNLKEQNSYHQIKGCLLKQVTTKVPKLEDYTLQRIKASLQITTHTIAKLQIP